MKSSCILNGKTVDCCGTAMHGRYCNKHYRQIQHGDINKNGKRNRVKLQRYEHQLWGNRQHYTQCILKGPECSNWYKGRFCGKHVGQYRNGLIDWDGNQLRPLKKGGKINTEICFFKGKTEDECGKKMNGTLCVKHYKQYKSGMINMKGKRLKLFFSRKYIGCVAKGNHGVGECTKYFNGRFCGRHLYLYHEGFISIKGKKLLDYTPQKSPLTFLPNTYKESVLFYNESSDKVIRHYIKSRLIKKYPKQFKDSDFNTCKNGELGVLINRAFEISILPDLKQSNILLTEVSLESEHYI